MSWRDTPSEHESMARLAQRWLRAYECRILEKNLRRDVVDALLYRMAILRGEWAGHTFRARELRL